MTDDIRQMTDEPSQAPQPAPRGSEPVFNLPAVVVILMGVMAAIQAVDAFYFTVPVRNVFLFHTAFIPARYGPMGEWGGAAFWSPITYSLLHGGWAHLALNCFWLAAFGSIVAHRIGAIRFLLFWILSSIAAAALFLVLNWDAPVLMVGASGVISALMGAASRFAFAREAGLVRADAHLSRRLTIVGSLSNRTVLGFLAVWFGINVLAATGFSMGAADTGIAWEAHIGGFLFGFFTFSLFDPLPPR